MDRYEVCRILAEAWHRAQDYSSGIDTVYDNGACIVVETSDGQRFFLTASFLVEQVEQVDAP